MSEQLFTMKQASERLGVSYQFLWRCCKKGLLPVVRLSPRCVRVKESDVVLFVNARRIAQAIITQTADARAERDKKRRELGLLTADDLKPPAD